MSYFDEASIARQWKVDDWICRTFNVGATLQPQRLGESRYFGLNRDVEIGNIRKPKLGFPQSHVLQQI